jgi:hypothetical protein
MLTHDFLQKLVNKIPDKDDLHMFLIREVIDMNNKIIKLSDSGMRT